MIQLIFDSADKIIPEWENEQERLVFRLSAAKIIHVDQLHKRLDEAGSTVPDDEAIGMVTLLYDGSVAHQVRIILELPTEQWDRLADRADDLLDQEGQGNS